MWFLSSWPWGDKPEPPCWLGGRRQWQDGEARQDATLGRLGRGGQSWNVCSASGSCLHDKRRTHRGQLSVPDLQEGRHRGQLAGLLWLMPVFWPWCGPLPGHPHGPPTPSLHTDTGNPGGYRLDRHAPIPFYTPPPSPPKGLSQNGPSVPFRGRAVQCMRAVPLGLPEG